MAEEIIEQVEVKDPFDMDNLLTSVDVADLWKKKNETIAEPEVKVEEPIATPEPEIIKQETKEPEPLLFANEESEKLYNLLREGKTAEVRQYLNDYDLYSNTDKLSSTEAIKLRLQRQHPDYTAEDINDIMEDSYSLPSKPQQGLEDDEEYEQRVKGWERQVEKVNRMIERDARTAKQELSKTIQELSLPEIKSTQQEPQLSAEEWANIDNIRKEYLKNLDATTKDSLGFDAVYKDEETQIPVSYKIPDEYKKELRQRLENFDLNQYFEGRYFTEKGIDAKKLMNDLFLLEHPELVFNGIANKSGAERLLEAKKLMSNIKVDGKQNSNVTFKNDDMMDRLAIKMLTS